MPSVQHVLPRDRISAPPSSLRKMAHSSLLTDVDLMRDRWRQHHAEVLSATTAPPPEVDVDMAQVWRPSCAAVRNILARTAFLPVVVLHLHDTISASISQCGFPVPWRGS